MLQTNEKIYAERKTFFLIFHFFYLLLSLCCCINHSLTIYIYIIFIHKYIVFLFASDSVIKDKNFQRKQEKLHLYIHSFLFCFVTFNVSFYRSFSLLKLFFWIICLFASLFFLFFFKLFSSWNFFGIGFIFSLT